MIAAVVVLGACSSSSHPKRPARASTTTATATSTTSVATSTSAPTTTRPSSVPGTTSTVSALAGPRIVSLTGPPTPVPCNAPTDVQLTWEVRGATVVTLRINGGAVFATYPNGRHTPLVPLACDGAAQTYQLTARAANGQSATRTLRLTERKS